MNAWGVLAVAASYLLGSIPVAVLVGRLHGVDPRGVGDRNPGYWNVKDHLGRRASMPVFAGDVAKGAAAAGLGLWAGGPWWVGYACVGAAMIGHAWPVFAEFRGGRSILTFVGGMVVLAPWTALIAITVCVATWLATGSFAYGARAGVFAFPVLQAFMAPRAQVAATGVLMAIIGLRFAQAWLADRASRPGPAAPPARG